MTTLSGELCALASVCTVPPPSATDWICPWAILFAQYARVASTVNPFGITVDATRAYWANKIAQGQIQSVALGGGTVQTLASAQSSPERVVISNGTLYWTNSGAGKIEKLPLTGGAPV